MALPDVQGHLHRGGALAVAGDRDIDGGGIEGDMRYDHEAEVTRQRMFERREADTGRCESCNGLHSDCGEA